MCRVNQPPQLRCGRASVTLAQWPGTASLSTSPCRCNRSSSWGGHRLKIRPQRWTSRGTTIGQLAATSMLRPLKDTWRPSSQAAAGALSAGTYRQIPVAHDGPAYPPTCTHTEPQRITRRHSPYDQTSPSLPNHRHAAALDTLRHG